MATALPFIMAGLQVAQGIQGYQQNNAMAKATSANAAANIQNEQNRLAINQKNLKRQQEIETGRATVAAAGSGATLGSFDTLFDDNSTQQLMDRAMLDYDSKLTQENIRYNAAVQKQEFKSAARSSLISGITSAAGGMAKSGSFGGSSAGSTGQSVGSIFSKSPTGPYLNYGSRTLSGY
jgi:hypothetical protein